MTAFAVIPARGGSQGVRRKNTDFDAAADFWQWVQPGADDACWLWEGRLDSGGYGKWDLTDRQVLAHRHAWELTFGPCPTDTLDHLCRVRACCNPSHMEPVSRGENVRRSPLVGQAWAEVQRAKTHCPQGHPYDEANTYVQTQANGRPRRSCRTCQREAMRRRRASR